MDYENGRVVRDSWNHLIYSSIFQERKHRPYEMRLLNVTQLKSFLGPKAREFHQADVYMS